jgi:hypothetical protein
MGEGRRCCPSMIERLFALLRFTEGDGDPH